MFTHTFSLRLVDERHAARVELGQLPLRLLVHLLELLGRLDVVGREEQLEVLRRRTHYMEGGGMGQSRYDVHTPHRRESGLRNTSKLLISFETWDGFTLI